MRENRVEIPLEGNADQEDATIRNTFSRDLPFLPESRKGTTLWGVSQHWIIWKTLLAKFTM